MPTDTSDLNTVATKNLLQRLFNEASPKVTQEQLAADTGLRLGSIKNWMSGRNDPKVTEVMTFGVGLGYSREYVASMFLEVVAKQK